MIEREMLLVLMAVSIGLFWFRLSKVLRIIRQARPTLDFEVSPISRRVSQFIWEVLLQGKVIAQRPLPGLAHAFVFWGFCAFGLITVNHIASAFGGRFLSTDSAFGRFYFLFVAVWAIAVGGFHRRPFRPPIRGAPGVARKSFAGIGRDRAADIHPHGDVPYRLMVRPDGSELVDSHRNTVHISAADSTHQAPALSAKPGHGFSAPPGLQPHSTAGGR